MPSDGSASRASEVTASKPREISTLPPARIGVRTAANSPAVWNIGMSHRKMLLGPTALPWMKLVLPQKEDCSVTITPLGRPLVPEV